MAADDRTDRAGLSAVAPIVELAHSPEAVAEEALVRVARRWARQSLRWLSWRIGLLTAGGGVGAGLATLDPDAPAVTRAAASGPAPSQAEQAVALDVCEQARLDARTAVDLCTAQALACGVDPADVPRPRTMPTHPAGNGQTIDP